MRSRFKTVLRITATVISIAFLVNDLAYAAPSLDTLLSPTIIQNPSLLKLPESVAKIQSWHQGNTNRLIIQLQDAHTNFSAQENLSKTLEELITRYQLKTVFVEGGTKDDSLSFLRPLAPRTVRERVAKKYMLKGELNGAEFLNLSSDYSMELQGVEEAALYRENLKTYAAIVDKREAVLAYLDEIQKRVGSLKRQFYSKDLLAFDDFLEKFEKKEEDYTGYYTLLTEAAGRIHLNLLGYPNFLSLKDLKSKEETIDFNKANQEQVALIEKIRHSERSEESIDEILRFSQDDVKKLKSQDPCALGLYEALFEKAKAAHVDLAAFPNLLKYADYLALYSTVNMEDLLKESKEIEERVYQSSLQNEEDCYLYEIADYLKTLRNLFSLQISKENFERYAAHQKDTRFETIVYLAFLNRKLYDLGNAADIVRYLPLVDDNKGEVELFYKTTEARDEIFVEKSLKYMQKNDLKIAALLAGGYHTPHLKELLKKQGVSYVAVTPNVATETNQARYEKLLLGQLDSKKKMNSQPISAKTLSLVSAIERAETAVPIRNEILAAARLSQRSARRHARPSFRRESEERFLELERMIHKILGQLNEGSLNAQEERLRRAERELFAELDFHTVLFSQQEIPNLFLKVIRAFLELMNKRAEQDFPEKVKHTSEHILKLCAKLVKETKFKQNQAFVRELLQLAQQANHILSRDVTDVELLLIPTKRDPGGIILESGALLRVSQLVGAGIPPNMAARLSASATSLEKSFEEQLKDWAQNPANKKRQIQRILICHQTDLEVSKAIRNLLSVYLPDATIEWASSAEGAWFSFYTAFHLGIPYDLVVADLNSKSPTSPPSGKPGKKLVAKGMSGRRLVANIRVAEKQRGSAKHALIVMLGDNYHGESDIDSNDYLPDTFRLEAGSDLNGAFSSFLRTVHSGSVGAPPISFLRASLLGQKPRNIRAARLADLPKTAEGLRWLLNQATEVRQIQVSHKEGERKQHHQFLYRVEIPLPKTTLKIVVSGVNPDQQNFNVSVSPDGDHDPRKIVSFNKLGEQEILREIAALLQEKAVAAPAARLSTGKDVLRPDQEFIEIDPFQVIAEKLREVMGSVEKKCNDFNQLAQDQIKKRRDGANGVAPTSDQLNWDLLNMHWVSLHTFIFRTIDPIKGASTIPSFYRILSTDSNKRLEDRVRGYTFAVKPADNPETGEALSVLWKTDPLQNLDQPLRDLFETYDRFYASKTEMVDDSSPASQKLAFAATFLIKITPIVKILNSYKEPEKFKGKFFVQDGTIFYLEGAPLRKFLKEAKKRPKTAAPKKDEKSHPEQKLTTANLRQAEAEFAGPWNKMRNFLGAVGYQVQRLPGALWRKVLSYPLHSLAFALLFAGGWIFSHTPTSKASNAYSSSSLANMSAAAAVNPNDYPAWTKLKLLFDETYGVSLGEKKLKEFLLKFGQTCERLDPSSTNTSNIEKTQEAVEALLKKPEFSKFTEAKKGSIVTNALEIFNESKFSASPGGARLAAPFHLADPSFADQQEASYREILEFIKKRAEEESPNKDLSQKMIAIKVDLEQATSQEKAISLFNEILKVYQGGKYYKPEYENHPEVMLIKEPGNFLDIYNNRMSPFIVYLEASPQRKWSDAINEDQWKGVVVFHLILMKFIQDYSGARLSFASFKKTAGNFLRGLIDRVFGKNEEEEQVLKQFQTQIGLFQAQIEIHRQNEVILETEANRLRSIADRGSPKCRKQLTPDGLSTKFIWVNSIFAERLGKTPEQIIGRQDTDFFPTEMAEKYVEDDLRVLRTGEKLIQVEQNILPGGSVRFVQVTKERVGEGEIQVTFMDVTDLRNAEKKLAEHRVQMKKLEIARFIAAMLAHVFNNQLTILDGNLAFLDWPGMKPEIKREAIQKIKDSTRVIKEYVQLFSAVNKINLKKNPKNLNLVVKEAVVPLANPKISIHKADDSLPLIPIREDDISSVISAITKFLAKDPEQKKLEISVVSDPERYQQSGVSVIFSADTIQDLESIAKALALPIEGVGKDASERVANDFFKLDLAGFILEQHSVKISYETTDGESKLILFFPAVEEIAKGARLSQGKPGDLEARRQLARDIHAYLDRTGLSLPNFSEILMYRKVYQHVSRALLSHMLLHPEMHSVRKLEELRDEILQVLASQGEAMSSQGQYRLQELNIFMLGDLKYRAECLKVLGISKAYYELLQNRKVAVSEELFNKILALRKQGLPAHASVSSAPFLGVQPETGGNLEGSVVVHISSDKHRFSLSPDNIFSIHPGAELIIFSRPEDASIKVYFPLVFVSKVTQIIGPNSLFLGGATESTIRWIATHIEKVTVGAGNKIVLPPNLYEQLQVANGGVEVRDIEITGDGDHLNITLPQAAAARLSGGSKPAVAMALIVEGNRGIIETELGELLRRGEIKSIRRATDQGVFHGPAKEAVNKAIAALNYDRYYEMSWEGDSKAGNIVIAEHRSAPTAARLSAGYGLHSQHLSPDEEKLLDILNSILNENQRLVSEVGQGRIQFERLQRVAESLVKMRKDSLALLTTTGVITADIERFLNENDAEGMNHLTLTKKRDFVTRLAKVFAGYNEANVSSTDQKGLEGRLIPIGMIRSLAGQFDTTQSQMIQIINRHPDFMLWLPLADKTVSIVSKTVGTRSLAWSMVNKFGIDGKDRTNGAQKLVEDLQSAVARYLGLHDDMKATTVWIKVLQSHAFREQLAGLVVSPVPPTTTAAARLAERGLPRESFENRMRGAKLSFQKDTTPTPALRAELEAVAGGIASAQQASLRTSNKAVFPFLSRERVLALLSFSLSSAQAAEVQIGSVPDFRNPRRVEPVSKLIVNFKDAKTTPVSIQVSGSLATNPVESPASYALATVARRQTPAESYEMPALTQIAANNRDSLEARQSIVHNAETIFGTASSNETLVQAINCDTFFNASTGEIVASDLYFSALMLNQILELVSGPKAVFMIYGPKSAQSRVSEALKVLGVLVPKARFGYAAVEDGELAEGGLTHSVSQAARTFISDPNMNVKLTIVYSQKYRNQLGIQEKNNVRYVEVQSAESGSPAAMPVFLGIFSTPHHIPQAFKNLITTISVPLASGGYRLIVSVLPAPIPQNIAADLSQISFRRFTDTSV